jgi:hypothetical protein
MSTQRGTLQTPNYMSAFDTTGLSTPSYTIARVIPERGETTHVLTRLLARTRKAQPHACIATQSAATS